MAWPPPASPTPSPRSTPVSPADPTATDRASFLFVQTFSAGTMTVHPDDPNRYLLTLTGHAAETVYFSDRPERIVGSVPTPQFLEGLGFPDDNPPNAALVAGEQVVVVELFNPVYSETVGDEGTATLTYDVAILADYAEEGLAHLALQANGDLPESFASASLFIDDCPDINQDCWLITTNPCRVVGNLGWRGTCWTQWGDSNYSYACVPLCPGQDLEAECNAKFPECAEATQQNGGLNACQTFSC